MFLMCINKGWQKITPNHWIQSVSFMSSLRYSECWICVEGFLTLIAYIQFVSCVNFLVSNETNTNAE